ncbi:MAG: DNA methylase [Methanosaeta sp. PtaB.Bin039]|nr:MAG: DNA methylase [Methanosaeta sp. PtaB.Bin039]OPY48202.1 MAG: DNA methylase [Methanosaeta sp. PtaU1.Bin028]
MKKHKRIEGNSKIQLGTAKPQGPVECLGMSFPDDNARREHFLGILREKLKDPEFRKIEGFPIGSDEDILALSDPPYYTACPNPFIADFIKYYGKTYDPTKPYSREPFAADVSEGKNDPIYNAHSYHTKVPHKAIMRYILHYTEPGDLVFDGFCGTGMTGVAAALCRESRKDQMTFARRTLEGQRWAILADLSPVATFIASNLLRPVDRTEFQKAFKAVCAVVEKEFGYLYSTHHSGWKVRDRKNVGHRQYANNYNTQGSIEFTLYSDVVRCPECTTEITLYEVLVDEKSDSLRSDIKCPNCKAVVPESKWESVNTAFYDTILKKTIQQLRIEPVLINYSVGSTRYEKFPDEQDREKLATAERLLATVGLPAIALIEGKETQRNIPIGITHLHHFFTHREHLFVAALLKEVQKYPDSNIRQMLLFALTASLPYASRMRRFRADRKGGGPLSGTLYISSLITPPHVLKTFLRNAATIADSLTPPVDPIGGHIISTQDAGHLNQIPDSTVDYIFTDPPFGHNFDYSELNFFWEGLLGVVTNQEHEAIVSVSQGKDIDKYRDLMEKSFSEYYRILKPGRWLTVEFSNTKASVWNAIQSALEQSGFVVANVASLDKKQHSFKAVMTPTAVKQDLIISAYKPNGGLEDRFNLEAGTEEGVWDFIRTHLRQLPVFVSDKDDVEVIAERQNFLLFDCMVAFHVQRGVTVPLSAAEFYEGLVQRFAERDNMYFLSEQVAEYDKKRMTTKDVLQLKLSVTDESSAILWLKQQLLKKPQTFQELHPQFLKEIGGGWQKNEKPLELSELLAQNFLRYDGKGEVPHRIHSYLSTNFKDLRNLPKDDERLRAKGKDRWYVPDPNQAGDLEKLRERSLLKEFDEYRMAGQKRLKVFRLEAVRAGFKKAWQERDYDTIISVARKIPENVLQEDPKLLMWYDQALTRSGKE